MIKYLDKLDSLHLAANGVYERQESKLIQYIVKPGQVFIDVGAHIGYYSVMAASLGATVFSFEPNLDNFNLLKRNTEGIKNVFIHNAAVGEFDTESDLYLCEENSGDHRLYKTEGRDRLKVRVMRIDSLPIRSIDFLKVDVQGFEYRVLLGARKLIERSNGINILIEYGPPYLKLAESMPGQLIGLLIDMGFFIYAKIAGEWGYADSSHFYSNTIKHQNFFCSRKSITAMDWGKT